MLKSAETVAEHRLSPHIVTYPLADGRQAAWNALLPRVVVLDSQTLDRLRAQPGAIDGIDEPTRRALTEARILYRGETDPSEDDFFRSAQAVLDETDREAAAFYGERQSYLSLTIANSGCNLGCSYCVSYYGDEFRTDAARQADRGDARNDAVMRVVDQFIDRKLASGDPEVRLNFNGGEILLRWPLVEAILTRVKTRCPDMRLLPSMNTNGTLVTPAIAERLAAFGVQIQVSIDGYRDAHDQTRHFHGGGGSFERVIDGIENYGRATGRPLTAFQGTIRDVTTFDREQLFQMSELGFHQARLSPNVLDVEPQRGVEAAFWEADLTVDSQGKPVEIAETHFEHVLHVLEKGRDGFSYHCNGLNGLHIRALTFNIDSMQLSQMCSFVSPAAVPLADLDYDIYNPELWNRTRRYIAGRLDMLRTACQGCDVLGVCQGGCVHSGLDVDNQLNEAACRYQRALFRHAIDYSHTGAVRPIPAGEIRATGDDAARPAASCCSSHDAAPLTVWRSRPTA